MENAENVVVLTTDVKDTESTKEESAEKDALLMTNVRGRGDFKRGEHRNFGDRREGRDNFKSSPRKFDDNKEKTEE